MAPPKLDQAIWSDVDTFLATGWPALVGAAATEQVAPSAIEAMLAAFAAWGVAPPAGLAGWAGTLSAGRAPALAHLQPGSTAPLPVEGNRAEQRLLAAQNYPPLWQELFAGAFEIGSTPSGDIWMFGYEPFTPGPAKIYLYNHELDALASTEATSLDALVFRAALYGAREAKALREADFSAAAERLAGKVGTAELGDDRDDEPEALEWGVGAASGARADWLIRVLSVEDVSDAELRSVFSLELNPPQTPELIARRAARFADYPPTAFYACLTAWLSGDDAILDAALALTRTSPLPIIRDLGLLMDELRAGRLSLGAIRDIQALRARVIALELWDPPAIAAAAHALEASDDPAIVASVAQLDAIVDDEGYRDEDVVAAVIAQGDRRIAPVLVARALAGAARHALLDVLAAWADPETVEPLLPLAYTINRFHSERFPLIRLVHGTWQPRFAPLLVALARKFPADALNDTGHGMLATLMLALADLGASPDAVAPLVLPLLDTEHDGQGSEAPIALRQAARYAAGELALDAAWPTLWEAAQGDAMYRGPGLPWALGALALRQPADVRAAVRARLDATRISMRMIKSGGVESARSIASLLDENLGGQLDDLAREIALEHARVALGAPDDALREVVTGVLTHWLEREDRGTWAGYDAHALLCWALIALRHRPDLGRELARPFLGVRVALADLLARAIVRA